jgi:SAM-dependent methyltransferase
VQAIEMDAACCHFLERELRVATVCSDDPAAALADLGQFDAIALWQVIEHVPDPSALIAASADALAPGGVLALAAPNPEALQLRIFRKRWTHLDAPRHLFLLPIDTVTRLGQKHGLDVVLETMEDFSALAWNSVIARAVRPVERRDRLGATYTVFLQRPRS